MNIKMFLDIDGVLATSKQFGIRGKSDLYLLYKEYPFDETNVEIFNSLVEQFDFDIVLSSDWRLNHPIEEMNHIFQLNGMNKKIFDYTDDLFDGSRTDEIKKYILDNKIEKYIIIDDLPLATRIRNIGLNEKWFVNTKISQGLKERNVFESITKILSSLN
jgi:hypothetical protein